MGSNVMCKKVVSLAALVIAAALVVILFVKAVESARHGAYAVTCHSNLVHIAGALQLYERDHGCLPPAYTVNDKGARMCSWRVLVLKYVDPALYSRYKFDEPWDSPNNLRVCRSMPEVYRCPEQARDSLDTSYMAVVGPHAAWRGAKSTQSSDFKGRDIISVVEVAESGVKWTEPSDLSLDKAAVGVNRSKHGISSYHRGGANCALWTAEVRWLEDTIPPALLRDLLTGEGTADFRRDHSAEFRGVPGTQD
jgi:hypothetical protein